MARVDAPDCAACKRPIEGKYYRMSGPSGEYAVCLKCYDDGPKCSLCTGFSIDWRDIDGMRVCGRCFEKVSSAPVCSICKKHVTGAYVQYGDGNSGQKTVVCSNCKEKAEKCSLCAVPSAALNYFEGSRLCGKCFAEIRERPVCALCAKHITGSYMNYTDPKDGGTTVVCDHCNRTNKKCHICGVPAVSHTETQGQSVCRKCFGELKKCHGCGKYILKLSYKYEIAEQSYCPDCQEKTPKCGVCGLPTGANTVVLTDGRRICPDCESTAVKDIETVKILYEIVADHLVKNFAMAIGRVNDVAFREISEMEELGKNTPTAEKGTIPLGIFSRRNEKFDIYIQKNLPRNVLIGVLAHEYAHAYMQDVSPDFKEIEVEEGFAEWIRYKALLKIGDEKGAKLIEARKDIYGKGFNRVRAVESVEGTAGVFRMFMKPKK